MNAVTFCLLAAEGLRVLLNRCTKRLAVEGHSSLPAGDKNVF